ncbi:MAG TPA: HAD family phosphatase [Solirubrobacteraceae bacterium]|jgi:putative hydrolase of the HAD superfamily
MTTDVFASFGAFCEREGLSAETVRDLFRSDESSRELLVGLETGTLPEAEFERRFAEILGIPSEQLIARMFAGAGADEAMLVAVRRARGAGIRTGLISNSWGAATYDRALLAELFDGVVISGDVGVRKPTPEIYEMGARAIDLPPADCVFVDDLPFNLKPARALGMATVRHVDAAQTIAELEGLLGVELA